MSTKTPTAELTDAQIQILDLLSTICAEQACMIREAKRAREALLKPSRVVKLLNTLTPPTR